MDNSAFVEDYEGELELPKNGKKQKEVPPIFHTFEEAISLAGCGKFHYQLLMTAGLCFLTIMSQILCIGVVLPAIKCDIDATLEEQGLLASAAFFGVVCSSHAMGFLGDTWGRVNTIKWSLILSTIAAVISAFSPNIWMLIVTRFLTGFFSSGCQSCVFSLCGEFHSNRTRARHVTLVSLFLTISLVYITIEAIFILPLRIDFELFGLVMSPWRLLLLLLNISPVAALILLNFTPETPKYDLIHGRHESALNTLRQMFARNTGRPVEEYPVKHIELEMAGANIADIRSVRDAIKMVWNQTIPVFYRERILHTLNICLMLFMIYGISHGLFMWYPTILTDELERPNDPLCLTISEADILKAENTSICNGQVDTLAYWLLIFIGLFYSVLYLLFSYTIDCVGKRNILIIWLIVCGLSSAAVNFISNLPMAFTALTLINSVSTLGGIVGTIAVEFFPTNINAMAMCFVMMIGRLGAVAGSNAFGLFLFSQCDWTFWILTGTLFAMAFMCWLLPETQRSATTPKRGKA